MSTVRKTTIRGYVEYWKRREIIRKEYSKLFYAQKFAAKLQKENKPVRFTVIRPGSNYIFYDSLRILS